MPELPEVEVARRNLDKWLRRGTLVRVELSPRLFVLAGVGSARSFAQTMRGRPVRAVERRGKWLRLALDGDLALFSHLGMTGKWVLRAHDAPPERFERARLDTPKRSVRYLDPRLFGTLQGARGEVAPSAWSGLGPDALVDGVDAARLHARLVRISRSIKEALLDQTILAGVGNIQAAEALWRARLNPLRASSSLSAAEVASLARAIEASIADTLAREDSPEITYVEEAGADNPFDVYGKHGEPCPRCGRTLRRIVQGGRSTVFCSRCQPPRRAKRRAT
ncbi:MAG: bifunctional DNA-formamidopyrimidine glycosylase/DNA-(apurinic or apyrimidinic site) lyase [Polyangia bacterium]